ncbi:uncharacterized protein TRIADDRAFT_52317 [Trichoplax adhaerens]|uniref:K Homology domain-containing protein n=1 Tax=Trichoplax adhaerens TaxID=10228 RepID=B3RHY5_TRIAD|nr:hypothetical protein TRIADDRAFT_52317 [Trichoplax adhaerens]EDV29669.1 hypothetical protein TRIADDRAFT_52317 [Trichoplax adhaerens]|eukprot:XP_002108871.1 hypothetical protein TRIADDRAFT_52317 [Trichoplax adhaerens]
MAGHPWYGRLVNRYSLSAVTLFAIFLWWKNKKNDHSVQFTEMITIIVTIPKDIINEVHGKNKTNLRSIEEKANVKINVKLQDNGLDYIAVIEGSSDNVRIAESALSEFIQCRIDDFTAIVKIPMEVYDRFMGRHGACLRRLTLKTGACIALEPPNFQYSPEHSLCVITGNLYDVLQAKSYVESRCADAMFIERETKAPGVSVTMELFKNDGFQPVYVTAIKSPSEFWVQPLSRERVYFENLEDRLTKFYSADKSNDMDDIRVGDFCAYYDNNINKWYRVKLINIIDENTADAFRLDYGNTIGDVPKSKLKFLCAEFRMLQFQAVRCSLANIEPTDGKYWSEEATKYFRQYVDNPDLIELYATVIDFQSQPEESTSLPLIELIDTSQSLDININYELVKSGYVKCINDEYVLKDETISPLSDVTDEASLCQITLEVPLAVSELSSSRNIDDGAKKKTSDASLISVISANVEMQEIATSFVSDRSQIDNDSSVNTLENRDSKLSNDNFNRATNSCNNPTEDNVTCLSDRHVEDVIDDSFSFRQNSDFIGNGFVTESSPRKLGLPDVNSSEQILEVTDGNSCYESLESAKLLSDDAEHMKTAIDSFQESQFEDD